MVQHLQANPHAYDDDSIKVWVRTFGEAHTEEFHAALEQHLEETGFFSPPYRELLQVSEGAPLKPGQALLLFRASNPDFPDVELGVVSPKEPEIVFQGVTFTTYHPTTGLHEVPLGDCRPLVAAARRALGETGGKDWFGGMGEFAAKYLRPPTRQKAAVPRKAALH